MSRDLFKPASQRKAFLKMGLFGLAGTGKTYTAGMMARGVVETMRAKGLDGADRPVFMFDTETGSDWIAKEFEDAGIELRVASTRAFSDLLDSAQWLQDESSVVIIDSISHFWAEFTEAYARQKNRTQGLQFQDWAYLKREWARFTSWFVNAPVHTIICGRQAYEYNQETNDRGKKEMVRGNAKMKAEGELGYEPSLLVQMERETAEGITRRIATVLKDRSRVLDGVELCEIETGGPTFESFRPHLDGLNLGGAHAGFDERRTSDDIIEPDDHPGNDRSVLLDEIKGALQVMAPSQSAADKRTRLDLLRETFGCRGWSAVEAAPIQDLRRGAASLDAMAEELEERLRPSVHMQDTNGAGASSPRELAPLDPEGVPMK